MEIIRLNLIPSGVNPTCHCSQYDKGRVIRIELFDGLTPYTLQSGDTVTLNVRKPDNTIVTASVTATQGNKYVDIVTTEQICACVGYNLCDLTITNGTTVIGTLNFIMAIERDVLADGIASQSVIRDLAGLIQEGIESEIAPLSSEVNNLNNEINGITNANFVEGKALNVSGELVDNVNTCVSDKIPYTWSGSTRYYTSGEAASLYVAFYDSQDVCLQAFTAPNQNAEYRPLNAETQVEGTVSYVRFTFIKGYAAKITANTSGATPVYWTANSTHTKGISERVGDLETDVAQIQQIIYEDKLYVKAIADTMTTGDTLTATENIDNRKNAAIEFHADITSFTSLTVGHGYQISYSSWFVIDDTNVTIYVGDGTTHYSHAHGLTIADFIHVVITQNNSGLGTIEITTSSGQYTFENTTFAGSRGDVFATCEGSFTNASLTAIFKDLSEDIFLFGDSYTSLGDTARYPYYLMQNGYTHLLISGFGGAKSNNEILSFRNILTLAKPKFVIWALGMNGQDTSDGINATYKECLDEVIATCEELGITPILATIPNTPLRLHTYKNQYVKSLGYRYIDFAKAVGAETAGSSWYTGMLSSDEVHPTALGAQALYARFLTDVPEIIK